MGMLAVVAGMAVFASAAGVWWYRRFALRRGIIARVSARGLHDRIVPRGGGLVFGVVFTATVLLAWTLDWILPYQGAALAGGGLGAVVVGFFDDLYEIPATRKLVLHAALSAWLFFVLRGEMTMLMPEQGGLALRALALALMLFVPMWLINVFNFIDGIDGLAGGAAVFVSITAALIIWLTGGPAELVIAFATLGAAVVGFMPMNLPQAKVFMGDAGSIFLGYTVAALLLLSVITGALSVWTWVAMLSYYIGDTTTTTLSRMFLVPHKWYGVHRSHAYQNVARVKQSHALVTYGVAAYNILWVLPLALLSALRPELAVGSAVIALIPPVLWALRFGPRYSSE